MFENFSPLDDFFWRAMIAGIGLAIIAAPLGCFMVWRRMAYFGDTLAHSALLGLALSVFFGVHLALGVFGVGALVALLLLALQRQDTLSTDALLGILSHATLAVGLVLISLMVFVRVDLTGLLFGDILAVSRLDVAIIYATGVLVAALLVWFWRPLLAATVSTELARAEGMKPELSQLVLMLLMAGVVAVAIKLVGVLLITSLLIIPAATARRFCATPEQMAAFAAVIGAIAVSGGLAGSSQWDTPSGPSIVVAALVIFVVSLALPARRLMQREQRQDGPEK